MVEAIIFDIDGTLVKISDSHKKAFLEYFKRKFNKKISIEEIDCYELIDPLILKEMAKSINKEIDMNEAKALLKDLFKTKVIEDNENLKLYNGVREMLDYLREKEIPMAIATGNLKEIAEYKLKTLKIIDYFCCIIGSDELNTKEEIIKKALEELGVWNNQDVFYVCDSLRDIEAAHLNKIKAVATIHKFIELDKADSIVNSIKHIIKACGVVAQW